MEKNILSERQSKKLEERRRQYQNKIIVYHVPLNHKRIVETWKKIDELFKETPSRTNLYQSYFKSAEEYSKALKERFQEPYFIHHRKHELSPFVELFIVGEKQHTLELVNTIAERSNLIKEVIKEIFIEEGKDWIDATLRRAYGSQDILLLYDTTKNPKKQEINIEW